MANEEEQAFAVAQFLLECALEGITEAGLPVPCRVCVVPGEIAWDDCSEGGQLAMSISSMFYSSLFPVDTSTDTTSGGVCGPGIAVAAMTLSLMRCAPIPDGLSQRAPTCAALRESAFLVARDSYWLRRSVLCCLKDLKAESSIVDYRVGAATVDGPAGGCVGNSLALFVGFKDA